MVDRSIGSASLRADPAIVTTASSGQVGVLAHSLASGVSAWARQVVRSFGLALRGDVIAYAVISLYFVLCGLYLHFYHETIFNGLIDHYYSVFRTVLTMVYVPNFVFVCLFLSAYRRRRMSVPAELDFFAPEFWARFGAGIVLIGFFIFMMTAYSTVKTMLPFDRGFPYDQPLAAIDAYLHGDDPWRFLHNLVDPKVYGVVIDRLYGQGWMLYWSALAFWICVSGRANAVRNRYVINLVLTWAILGNVMAGLAKSAGPMFYGQVTGDTERFGEITAVLNRLAEHGGLAASFRDYLWAAYESRTAGVGSGISAFPSLHVAIVTLNALYVRELFGKMAQTLAWSYLAFTLFASVYLGWHYAIDGYASIVAVIAIYALLRMVSRRLDMRGQPQPAPA